MMRSDLERACSQHPEGCPDSGVVREYAEAVIGIPIWDGGSSFMEIYFCPWCGESISSMYVSSSSRFIDTNSAVETSAAQRIMRCEVAPFKDRHLGDGLSGMVDRAVKSVELSLRLTRRRPITRYWTWFSVRQGVSSEPLVICTVRVVTEKIDEQPRTL